MYQAARAVTPLSLKKMVSQMMPVMKLVIMIITTTVLVGHLTSDISLTSDFWADQFHSSATDATDGEAFYELDR